MKNYSYHCSPVGDIKIFEPTKSKRELVVFSTPYKTLAYVFGIKDHNDYIISLQTNPLRIVEMCPNALERFYKEQSAYLYTFYADDFKGRTHWSGEITSDKPVKPLSVDLVSDLHAAILNEESLGNLEILRYKERNKYKNMDEKLALRNFALRYFTDETCIQHDIDYVCNLGNKKILFYMQQNLNDVYHYFTSKEIPTQHLPSIIPDFYREKYSHQSDDKTVLEVLSNIFTLEEKETRFATIDELKMLNNKDLLSKITSKLKRVKTLLDKN